jgi:hypothetical protein
MYAEPMLRHRLTRLSQLTQGAALVGLGLGLTNLACSGPPPHVNSGPDTSATPSAAPAEPKHVNAPAADPPATPPSAPPDPPAHVNSPSPSTDSPPIGKVDPKPPTHTNAPPTKPKPPTHTNAPSK